MGYHVLKNKNQEATVAYKLFNKRFNVLVQNKAFYSAFDLEEIGFVSCGSVLDNETYLSEYRLVSTTIDKIAEWHYRGDSIRFTDLKDATTMYRIADEHMNNWLEVSRTNAGIKIPPIEDFEALDKLCGDLHPLVDINVNDIDDPMLLMLFGNALGYGFMNKAEDEQGALAQYVPYSPRLYTYTKHRWDVL